MDKQDWQVHEGEVLLPQAQGPVNKMRPPRLHNTELSMVIKSLDFVDLSRALSQMHLHARRVASLGLREHKTLLTITRTPKGWKDIKTHNGKGNIMPKFVPPDLAYIIDKGKGGRDLDNGH